MFKYYDRVLHLPDDKILDIVDKLPQIKKQGFTAILTSALQPSKEEWNVDWHMRYQVNSIYGKDIGNLMGSKDDLKLLCNKAHEIGLNIYVDVVFTHFGNKGGMGLDELTPHESVDEALRNNPYYWKNKNGINYNDRYSITHDCNNLATLRLDNFDLQDIIIDLVNAYIDLGVDGIRIDSCKLISCPHEYFKNECRNMFFERFKKGLKKDIVLFGEVINENKEIIEMYQNDADIDVLSNISYDLYNVDRNKVYAFYESHDTFLNDGSMGYTKRLSIDEVIKNYKYACKDFPKTVFYNRAKTDMWKREDVRLINNRYKR